MDKIKYKITKHISYTFTEEVYAKSSDEALDIASEYMVGIYRYSTMKYLT